MPLFEDGDLNGEKSRLFVAIVCSFTLDNCYNYFDETTGGSAERKLFWEFSDYDFGKIGGSFNSSVSDSLSIELPNDIRLYYFLEADLLSPAS